MYKNTTNKIICPLLIALATAAGIWIGKMTAPRNINPAGRVAAGRFAENKLVYMLSLIDSRYIDPVNMDSLTESVIPDLLAGLDPHSVYMPAKEFTEVNEALEGEFEGIGIHFNMLTDTVVVLNVISGGPSDKAGLHNGDRIIMIDDSLVAGRKVPQDDILKMLKGKGGTEVRLKLQRQGIADFVPVTVIRGKVIVKSVDAAYMIKPEIGFVKLSTFSRNSISELQEALKFLESQGMKKLIFDLRGNGGGFLDQAILIANTFLPGGKLIVYTEDRKKNRQEQYSDGTGKYADMEMAVLIDEGSASSSEILTGALQDNDRGTVVGRRSFGKGLVQEQIPFRDGSAFRLTIARYYTPTGRSIQKSYENGLEDYMADMAKRYAHNEFFSADSIHFADSLKFTTPGGKTVYGGGGIMPDIFVPLDTAGITKYYIQVANRNILYRYTMEYADRNRDKLNEVRTIPELNALLDGDTKLFDNFIQYASAQGVKPNYKDIAVSRPFMEARIRAYIGRNTPLEDAGMYSQEYALDNEIGAALEVLDND